MTLPAPELLDEYGLDARITTLLEEILRAIITGQRPNEKPRLKTVAG